MSAKFYQTEIAEVDLLILDKIVDLLKWISSDYEHRDNTGYIARNAAVELQELFEQRIDFVEERY